MKNMKITLQKIKEFGTFLLILYCIICGLICPFAIWQNVRKHYKNDDYKFKKVMLKIDVKADTVQAWILNN